MATDQTDKALATTPSAQPAPPLSTTDRAILANYLGHRLRPKALGESTAQPAAIEAWARSPQIAPHIAGFYFINALASHAIHTGNYIDAQLAISREFAKASSSSQRYTALNAYIRLCNATRSQAPISPFRNRDQSAATPARNRSRRNQLARAARALTTDDDATSFSDPQSPSFDAPFDPAPIHRNGDSAQHHHHLDNGQNTHNHNGENTHRRNGDITSPPTLPVRPPVSPPASSCPSRPSRSTPPPGQNTPAPSIPSSSLPPSVARTPAADLPSPPTSTPTQSPSSSSIPSSSISPPGHESPTRRLMELSGAAQAGAWP